MNDLDGLAGADDPAQAAAAVRVGEDAGFRFRLTESRDMESWGDGITFLSDWNSWTRTSPPWARRARSWKLMRYMLWVVRYRLA